MSGRLWRNRELKQGDFQYDDPPPPPKPFGYDRYEIVSDARVPGTRPRLCVQFINAEAERFNALSERPRGSVLRLGEGPHEIDRGEVLGTRPGGCTRPDRMVALSMYWLERWIKAWEERGVDTTMAEAARYDLAQCLWANSHDF
jgi:hypothetical protein